MVLELRLDRARTTKDVDLRLVGDSRDLLPSLKAMGQLDLGDWLSFVIEPDATMPDIAGPGMVYDGLRFRAEARLAGKVYGDPFGVDVGFADAYTMPRERPNTRVRDLPDIALLASVGAIGVETLTIFRYVS